MSRARDLAAFVSNADGDIKFDTDTLFIDSSTNRVGIGKTDPAHPLDVDGEVRFNSNIRLTEATSSAETGSINLSDSALMQIQSFGTGGQIAFDTGSSATERMRIDDANRVAIGISPAAVADSTGVASLQNGGSFLIHYDIDGSGTTSLNNNMYFDGNANKALFYGSTSQYYQTGGIHYFRRSGVTGAGSTATMSEIVRFDGDGIKFNGDTAGANALNDYEYGTCTITLASTGVNPSFSSGGTFTATYCKIGKTVTVHGYTGAATITSAGTGIAKVTGLPFAMASGTYSMAHFTHSTLFGASQHGYIETGQTFFYPIVNGSTAGVNYSTGTFYMMFTATYITT